MFSTKIFFGQILFKNNNFFHYFLPEISRNNVVMSLFISFAGQPIYRLVHHNLLSRLFQEVLLKNRNVYQQILADSGIIQITLFILIMFVEGQQEFFQLGLQRHFRKEIFNNLAFESTLVYQSITKKHCWLFSQTQRTKRFLFVSETLYL